MSLKEQRNKKGYTAKELGAITGISYRTIQTMEIAGECENRINKYSLDGLCRLSIALGCGISDLLIDEKLKARYKLAIKNEKITNA